MNIPIQFRTIPTEQTMFFFHHLSVMMRAGLSLPDALTAVGDEVRHVRFQRIIRTVTTAVTEGVSFADACWAAPEAFPAYMIQLFRTGEAEGNLEKMFLEIAGKLKKDLVLLRRVRAAMLYPSIILLVMLGCGIFLMAVVLPQLVSLFASIDTALPWTTRFVIAVGEWSIRYGFLALITCALLLVLGVFLLSTERGRRAWHRVLLRLPIVGPIARHVALARFSRTLSALLDANIDLPNALDMTGATMTNRLYREACIRYAEAVRSGVTLGASIHDAPHLFPPLLVQMITAGEQTGTIASTLKEGSEFYEDAVAVQTDTLPALIEPILIVLLGCVVGLVAVAVMMPMYSLAQNF